MRLAITNSSIALLLVLMAADALPALCPPHQGLKQWITPLLRRAGLWQGEWALFAPQLPTTNCRMTLELESTNSFVEFWESPRFENLSVMERCRLFREGQFFNNIYNDRYSGAWESVADYIARTEQARLLPGQKLARINLRRHWRTVPPPGSGLPPPEMEESYQVYSKEFGP